MTSVQDVASKSRLKKAERVADELEEIGIDDPTVSHSASEIVSGQTVKVSKVYAGSFDNDRAAADEHREEVRDTISTGTVYIHTDTPNPELAGVEHNLVIIKISEEVTSSGSR